MIKIAIIEDEQPIRDTYKLLLNQNFSDIEIVGEAGKVADAVALIKNTAPQVVFMDIELEDGNSFHVLQNVRPYNFKVIFLTAYNNFAIKAIKFSAFDYIMKPINEFEFINAVRNAIDSVAIQPETNEQFNNLLDHYSGTQKNRKIVLRTTDSMFIVKISDISYCKSDNSYTTFVLYNKRDILVSKGMCEYVGILEEYGFARPHQSYMVNINQIHKIDKTDGGFVVMENGREIPISSRRKQQFLSLLETI
ncbi:MAG: LytTR family DNA-binding domain-containing protein [Methanolobus sp.]|jgi:two-component system LytT family response regulator|nr:LytTR family DNA-binding domain-containing protein [Methanolobus sp.]